MSLYIRHCLSLTHAKCTIIDVVVKPINVRQTPQTLKMIIINLYKYGVVVEVQITDLNI